MYVGNDLVRRFSVILDESETVSFGRSDDGAGNFGGYHEQSSDLLLAHVPDCFAVFFWTNKSVALVKWKIVEECYETLVFVDDVPGQFAFHNTAKNALVLGHSGYKDSVVLFQ